jgi:GntR family transcriptional regulator, galactonate operon transcriptional repressor
VPTLHRQVLDLIGEQICSGHYAAATVLPAEDLLAEEFEVSRITIREAMKSLSAKGMLQVRRRHGTLVLPRSHWQLFDPDVIRWRASTGIVDDELMRDMMELRRIVEPNAAELAARRGTEEDRIAVRRAFRAMERAITSGRDYVAADLAFHSAILDACHNQFVQHIQQALSALLRIGFEVISEVEGGPARSLPMHEALCSAIERGDAEGARQAVLTLIERAETDYEDRAALKQAGRASASNTASKTSP